MNGYFVDVVNRLLMSPSVKQMVMTMMKPIMPLMITPDIMERGRVTDASLISSAVENVTLAQLSGTTRRECTHPCAQRSQIQRETGPDLTDLLERQFQGCSSRLRC